MPTDAAAWVREWFTANATQAWDEALWQDNYLEAGLIDSFGLIGLIDAVEQAFALRIPADSFQDRRFATMAGLAAIIDELRSAKG